MEAKRARAWIPTGSRTASYWIAWSLCASALALNFCGLLLSISNGTLNPDWSFMFVVLSSAAVGGVVASRRPANPVGWLFLGATLGFALQEFARQYAIYGLLIEPGTLPAAEAFAWVTLWAGPLGATLMFILLPLYFPDGRPVSPRWRPVVGLCALVSAADLLLVSLMPDSVVYGTEIVNPLGVEALRPVQGLLDGAGLVVFMGLILVAVSSLVARFLRSAGEERLQIKWFMYAVSVVLVWFLVNWTIEAAFPGLFLVLDPLVISSIPVAAGVAILKYRLYDIDLVINRTLVYGALTACVVGIYVLVVGYLGAFFHVEDNLAISLVATGAVAVLFAPLRERLQRTVNRLMYGERDDPYGVLSRLGERLEATFAPEDVLSTVVRAVREALKLPYVAIALKEGEEEFVIAAESGSSTGTPLRLPLVYQGETIGDLLLSPRAPGEEFTRDDRRLLDDLARQAGIAVHTVRLTADLQRSRERLVTAREEERRRLRRDLHDGLGPTLGSLPIKLDVAGDLLEEDPATARDLLRGLKTQAQGAVGEIRRLVYALRPPALDDLGLLGAVREMAAQHGTNVLSFSVAAPKALPPLPAAVEVAAYRIVQEAITNVVRHAAASACVVSLELDEAGTLRLEVKDDGRGLSPADGRGVGIFSMGERAAELGGSCTIAPLPTGGTRVLASLPCPRPTKSHEAPPAAPKE